MEDYRHLIQSPPPLVDVLVVELLTNDGVLFLIDSSKSLDT